MPSIPAQEEFLAATRKGQEAMITTIKTWFEAVRTTTPKLASAYTPLTDKLPRLPSVSMPFADQLPRPEEAVASAYHLAEQLLAGQRKFAEDLLEAMVPLTSGRATPNDTSQGAPQDHGPSEPSAQATSQPKTTTARPAQRSTAATSEPKSTAARPAPKTTKAAKPKGAAARRAPKDTPDS